MKTLQVNCYLYNASHLGAVSRSDQTNTGGSTTDATTGKMTVTVPLMPIGKEQAITVSVKMIKENVSQLACKPGDVFWWSDVVADGQVQGQLVHTKTPKSPDWTGTALDGDIAGPVTSEQPNLHPENAVPDSSADDALWYTTWESIHELTAFSPGEKMTMQADYRQNIPVIIDDYYTALALTSGIITDKIPHPDIANAYVYYVDVEGYEMGELYPTDFLEYEIGDRVGILKESAQSKTFVRDDTLLRPAQMKDLDVSNLRPAPVRFL